MNETDCRKKVLGAPGGGGIPGLLALDGVPDDKAFKERADVPAHSFLLPKRGTAAREAQARWLRNNFVLTDLNIK